jgi:hypothetical protein
MIHPLFQSGEALIPVLQEQQEEEDGEGEVEQGAEEAAAVRACISVSNMDIEMCSSRLRTRV